MGKLQIISASERMAERRGVKALVCGLAGIGKTTLLKTLDPDTTLFLDFEAGDLAVSDHPVDQVRPETWDECRNLAAFLAGPDRNAPDDAVYGRRHYEYALSIYGDSDINKYQTYFIDSLTVASRLCLRWSQQQPEASNSKGVPDMRSAYGLLGREMVAFITQLQQVRDKNVIFVCLMNENKDEFGRKTYDLQLEGSKIAREAPGIVDELITMAMIEPTAEAPGYRAFITDPGNHAGYPAKDRSGKLDPIEEPNLGKLLSKLTN